MKPKINPEKVLHLYRAILRSAREMPTERRVQYIKKKARDEFEEGRKVCIELKQSYFFFMEFMIVSSYSTYIFMYICIYNNNNNNINFM